MYTKINLIIKIKYLKFYHKKIILNKIRFIITLFIYRKKSKAIKLIYIFYLILRSKSSIFGSNKKN